MDGVVGDSGAGLIHQHGNNATFDGILISVNTNSSDIHFHTAWDVKNQLGFDFNCDPAPKFGAASQWGSCPSINR